jgi:kinesin family protein C2/C3
MKSLLIVALAGLAKLPYVSWLVHTPNCSLQPVHDARSWVFWNGANASAPQLLPADDLSDQHSNVFSRHRLFWWHVALDLLLLFTLPKLKARWWTKADADEIVIAKTLRNPAGSDTRCSEVARVLLELKDSMLTQSDLKAKDIVGLQEHLDRFVAIIAKAEHVGLHHEDLVDIHRYRRKLHNMVLDLKGCMRVFCRIRPLCPEELANGEECILQTPDNMSVKLDEDSLFRFDAVFNSGTQEDLFEECKGLVQSVVDGYSVALFSYGQTGAGKTFTMYGDVDNKGIVPRAITELYTLMSETGNLQNYRVTAQMFEIYQNTISDLAACCSGHPTAAVTLGAHKVGLVPDAVAVPSEEELLALLARGQAARRTCPTAMNPHSSRSHLVLIVEVAHQEVGEKVSGKLLFCDLAGSERIKKSKVVGTQQKEAIEVNKSLSALFHVLEMLARPVTPSAVPYRNSKLTQIMKDSLGGRSKTLMILNCSPTSSHRNETSISLARAARARKIRSSPKKQSVPLDETVIVDN